MSSKEFSLLILYYIWFSVIINIQPTLPETFRILCFYMIFYKHRSSWSIISFIYSDKKVCFNFSSMISMFMTRFIKKITKLKEFQWVRYVSYDFVQIFLSTISTDPVSLNLNLRRSFISLFVRFFVWPQFLPENRRKTLLINFHFLVLIFYKVKK